MPEPIVTVPGDNRQVIVNWLAPNDDGGCPILSYHLYLRDLQDASEFAEIDQLAVNNNPYLRSHTIDMSGNDIGFYYLVKVTVDNSVGTTESDSVVFLLADLPGKPNSPARISDGKFLSIVMETPDSDGGSPIINYQL
jgi:hypothetical protein